jgi:hypothetical protein
MVWEVAFFLVVLKIPVIYMGVVVWLAIRDEPRRDDPTVLVPVADTPAPVGPGTSRRRIGPRRRMGPGGPRRRPVAPRSAGGRVEVRR